MTILEKSNIKCMPYFKDCFNYHQLNKLSSTTERASLGTENYDPQDPDS